LIVMPRWPLELHVVEHLVFELPLSDGACPLEEPVGQCALAVVDVGDDEEVADVFAVDGHAMILRQDWVESRARPAAPIAPASPPRLA